MLELVGLDHIVLRTARLAPMLDFYCGVLGCAIERETSLDLGLTQLRAGAALIDLVAVDSKLGRIGGGPPAASGNNLDHFCLQLKPLSEKAILGHLNEHGIKFGEFASRYGAQGRGNSIYIQDPDGNTVELRVAL